MFGSWLNISMLALESQQVIALRLSKMSFGGAGALREGQLMVFEKLEAAWAAADSLAGGAAMSAIVEDYRRTVQANALRLSHES